MSDEENSGVFSRRKDYERRVPVAILPLPHFGRSWVVSLVSDNFKNTPWPTTFEQRPTLLQKLFYTNSQTHD